MKKIPFGILLMTLAIVVLCANTLRQHYAITSLTQGYGQRFRSMTLLQVQVMDRLLEVNRGVDVGVLLSDPDSWLGPLKRSINSAPEKIALLKQVAFPSTDKLGQKCFDMYCNPVNSEIEPYEVFTFYFQGEQCTDIKRKALLPW